MIAMIVAIGRNFVIGDAHGMPWHLPADLKRFRQLTLGKPIIMGRTTFEHIGKPLDQRTNIVLSRRPDFQSGGVLIARSLEEAIALAGEVPEVMIVGGGEVYRTALPYVERIYLTVVDGDFAGTAYFPTHIPTPAGFTWLEQERTRFQSDAKNPHAHEYVLLERVARPTEPAMMFPIPVIREASERPATIKQVPSLAG